MDLFLQRLDLRVPRQIVQALAGDENVRLQVVHHSGELLGELRSPVVQVRRESVAQRRVGCFGFIGGWLRGRGRCRRCGLGGAVCRSARLGLRLQALFEERSGGI